MIISGEQNYAAKRLNESMFGDWPQNYDKLLGCSKDETFREIDELDYGCYTLREEI